MFRYGLKEVADVVFYNIATGKPELFFDTLKVSTIENESESAEARGGRGNPRRISWDFGRNATLTMQDALLSDVSLSMLAGTNVRKEGIKVNGREVVAVNGGKITLKSEPTDSKTVHGFLYKNGVMTTALTLTQDTNQQEFNVEGAEDGDQVIVFYEYLAPTGSTQVTFTGKDFPATYRVVGDTLGRGEDGIDRVMQFIIPRAKLQSTFSLTMDVENVSTFDFNLEIMTEPGQESNLYHVIHLPDETDLSGDLGNL